MLVPLFLHSCWRSVWRRPLLKVFVIVLYLALGVAVFQSFEVKPCESAVAIASHDPLSLGDCEEPLSFIDALYMTVVSISTVGYGDFSPGSTGTRVFTCFYLLLGCSYIFVLLSSLFTRLLDWYRLSVLRFLDRFDLTPATVADDTTGDGQFDSQLHIAGRSMGISGRGIDLSGDGQVDFIEPPSAFIYWAQELLPAVLLWVLLQLLSAWIFMTCQSNLDFGTALYHCFITATTVGYGDVALETQSARLWASAHILVSVSWLAALFGQIDSCSDNRKGQLNRAALLTKEIDHSQIVGLDQDGSGVDKLEFVIGMLQNMGVKLCGEPLQWDDVRPFIKRFDEYDRSKTGQISKEDLEQIYQVEVQRHKTLVKKLNWSDAAKQRVKRHAKHKRLAEKVNGRGRLPNEPAALAKVVPGPSQDSYNDAALCD